MRTTNRRQSLMLVEERTVLALAGVGWSLEVSAAFLGRTPGSIRGFARRNKKFRERLEHAELHGVMTLLEDVAAAAETDPEADQWLRSREDIVARTLDRYIALHPGGA
ncbi:MAG: hypothetical protein WD851_13975 [Pirellulales bacterium]